MLLLSGNSDDHPLLLSAVPTQWVYDAHVVLVKVLRDFSIFRDHEQDTGYVRTIVPLGQEILYLGST